MNITFTKRKGYDRLLLLMAGWGMDFNPFTDLDAPGYDIAVACDYRDEDFDPACLNGYREIALIAWSMGVMEADRILSGTELPLTLTVAVNGTLSPVSDTDGIPVNVFKGTLDTMSPANLQRFNKRMCGSRERLALFESKKPERDIENLIDELRILGERAIAPRKHLRWDRAVIGNRDLIFPAQAQRNAWSNIDIIDTDEPHLPDFQAIIDSLLIDKDRVANCFNDTRSSYNTDATVQDSVAASLNRKLQQATARRVFERVMEIGAGGGQLTHRFLESFSPSYLELWDIAPLSTVCSDVVCKEITDDAEARLFATESESFDLVISASTLQWFNSVPGALKNIERILRPGGLAAISLYTSGTFKNISELTGSTLRYYSPDYLKGQIPANCIIKEWTTQTFTQSFDSTRKLLAHIKSTGVNGTRKVNPGIIRHLIEDNSVRNLEYNSTFIIFEKI